MLTPENQDLASCNVVSNPDIFFPNEGDEDTTALAKSICAQCPVAFDCLETAMADSDLRKWGIWGGTTPEERKAMSRTPNTRLRIFAEVKSSSDRVRLSVREVAKTLPSSHKNNPFS